MLVSSIKARRSTNSLKSKTDNYCPFCLALAFSKWLCATSRNRFNDADWAELNTYR